MVLTVSKLTQLTNILVSITLDHPVLGNEDQKFASFLCIANIYDIGYGILNDMGNDITQTDMTVTADMTVIMFEDMTFNMTLVITYDKWGVEQIYN